jgi:hypothetical protein
VYCLKNQKYAMPLFFTPVLTSALWVGGGPLSLLLIVAFVRPLLFRKSVNHLGNDFSKPRF